MKVDIVVCARCGGRHRGLQFRRLPKTVWWWAMCPRAKEPILVEEV